MFAWDACNAPGIDPAFICHHLIVNPSITSKKQPPGGPSREHADAIRDEVMILKRVGAIKEVFYSEWLANIVVVNKKNGKWRVFVDFTDLNKACPKDPFPMPRIPAGGCNSGPSSDEFPRCLSGLPSNIVGPRRSGEDSLCDAYWELSLQSNDVWPKERRFHLSKDDD